MVKKKSVKKKFPIKTQIVDKNPKVEKKVGKFLYWTPRILAIIFILFLMMFSLDVFEPGLTVWQIIIGLIMHNIPAFILAVIVAISWKHELVGAIAFVLAGLLYILLILFSSFEGKFEWYMISYSLIIAGPAILVGVLFYLNWLKKKR